MSTTTPTGQQYISQELFDETVLENEEVFELSPQEAVQETLSQYSHLDLSHLVRSHPSTQQQQQERLERQEFVQVLEQLKEKTTEEEEEKESIIVQQALALIASRIQSNPQAYLVLLQQQNEGMATLVSLFNATKKESTLLLSTIMETLIVILTPTTSLMANKNVQSELRDYMIHAMTHWMTLFTTTTTSSTEIDNSTLQSLLLQLAFVSCRYKEANKKEWMHAATLLCHKNNGIDALLQVLQQPDDNNTNVCKIRACHVISTLCRFDDFQTPTTTTTTTNNTQAPGMMMIISSANDNAMEFARHGAVPILYQVAQHQVSLLINNNNNNNNNDCNTKLLSATLLALRVLAIHNDIIQTMVAVGVLKLVGSTLQQHYKNETIAAATLGLIRNLCANDDIKTSLCCNKDCLIVPNVLKAMQVHSKCAQVQEHACGSMAAMALRKPSNTLLLVKHYNAHLQILAAMQTHGKRNVCVQRQGALALRNFASRALPKDNIVEMLLDAGAEQVLRQAGEMHQTCVDESYAALRDLGCNVQIIKYTKNEASGKLEQEETKMFGETKPNFRPVLEESSNTTSGGGGGGGGINNATMEKQDT